MKNLFLIIFRNNDVDHSAISNNALLFLYDENDLKKYIDNKNIISETFIQKLIKKNYSINFAKNSNNTKFFRKILTDIKEFLKDEKNKFENQNFLISIAEQCWLNEYVWFVNNEKKKLSFKR